MISFQYSHKLASSVKLWIEHILLDKGGAYTNHSGFFYPVGNLYSNYYTYALPYQPLVADNSISGPIIMSGIYRNGIYITPGSSGLIDVNFEKGQVYFNTQITSPNTNLSGSYAVADYNVKFTALPEETLLFETKFDLKNRTNQTITGLQVNNVTFPVVYIKPGFKGTCEPFGFGGTEKEVDQFRLIVLGDSQYSIDGIAEIFKEKTRTLIPLLASISEMPFNNFGGYANGIYNYSTLTAGRSQSSNSAWLQKVDVGSLPGSAYSEIKKLNPKAFVLLVDLWIESYRSFRS